MRKNAQKCVKLENNAKTCKINYILNAENAK